MNPTGLTVKKLPLIFGILLLILVSCKKDKDKNKAVEDALAIQVKNTNTNTVNLYYLRSDGANFTRVITNDLGNYLSSPAWSADRRKIFFAINTSSPNVNGVYSVSSNGDEFKPVYKDNDTQTRKFYQVVASKDDEHVVVSLQIPRTGRKVIELYRMCPCGQRVTRLTSFETSQSPALISTESYGGSFSRDSRYLYFVQSDPNITGAKQINIYRQDMVSNELLLIRNFVAADVLGAVPSISPDGSRILISIDGAIKVMNADGTDLQDLALSGYRPSWDNNNADFFFSTQGLPGQFASGIYRTNLAKSEIKPISKNSTAWTFGGFGVNN